jgi:DNA-directed RNA polymerase specialized sigma subunit
MIARELAVTPGRISQLHAQALMRIRQMLKAAPELDLEM